MCRLIIISVFAFSANFFAGNEVSSCFFNKKEINVGTVPLFQNEITVKFDYYNQTGKTVVFQKIRPSCGCTNVVYPKSPIRNKERGFLTATISFGDMTGNFSKSILVYAEGIKPVVLRIKGNR